MSSYTLATGQAGSERLDLVELIYGTQSREALLSNGLGEGMNVCDIGAGTGSVALWMAEQVGPSGSVTAVDRSAAQLELLSVRAAARNLPWLRMVCADATNTGLARGGFDLVFSRAMINHLVDPIVAVREMVELVRPGGQVVVAEVDLGTIRTMPPTHCYDRLRELYIAFAIADGRDGCNGNKLPALLRAAGLEQLDISMVQPAYLHGEAKQIMSRTITEARAHIEALGLETRSGLDELLAAVDAVEHSDAVSVAVPAMTACWGRRPGGAA